MTKLLVRKIYTIEIESEICCELCCEVIHNHIEECPICHTKFASTDSYHNLEEDEDTYIQCNECDSYLQIVDGRWYGIFDEDEILEKPYLGHSQIPKVIQIDPPIIEKEIEQTSKATYTIDPTAKQLDQRTIEAMKNFKLFESLSETQPKNFFLPSTPS